MLSITFDQEGKETTCFAMWQHQYINCYSECMVYNPRSIAVSTGNLRDRPLSDGQIPIL